MGRVCQHCGCNDIDVDAARGDAVCTGCGSVLEEHIIVSETQFEENAHGGTSAVGQFVGADGKGGRAGAFTGVGRESREVTLRNAKKKLTWLGQKLRLNQHCVDTAFNFFKMALSGGLTRGRRSELVIGACLYITCRTEGTAHMLIDFSDALLLDVCELGRTYTTLSTALCINVPVMDPCLYVLRFANKLELGDRTHEVSVTAARLMQRMKRDWIHMGRRPSGLCGAALLLSARLHGFSRSVQEIVGIVRVHHSTVRKRLMEFKNTPSSSLTLEEFMTVDLDEEVDPPSFSNSRKKDKDRLGQLFNGSNQVASELQTLQAEIDKELEDRKQRLRFKWDQDEEVDMTEATSFVELATMDSIRGCVGDELGSAELDGIDSLTGGTDDSAAAPTTPSNVVAVRQKLSTAVTPRHAEVGLGVSSALLGMGDLSAQSTASSTSARLVAASDPDPAEADAEDAGDNELSLEGIDDSEIDSYIMSSREILFKSKLWLKLNADYLKEEKEKRRLAEEEEARQEREGRPAKRVRRRRSKALTAPATGFRSAEEAIERMLHEKKLSAKINYDVLRELSGPSVKQEEASTSEQLVPVKKEELPDPAAPSSKRARLQDNDSGEPTVLPPRRRLDKPAPSSLSCRTSSGAQSSAVEKPSDKPSVASSETPSQPAPDDAVDEDDDDIDDYYAEPEPEEDSGMLSAAQLLNQHTADEYGHQDEEYY